MAGLNVAADRLIMRDRAFTVPVAMREAVVWESETGTACRMAEKMPFCKSKALARRPEVLALVVNPNPRNVLAARLLTLRVFPSSWLRRHRHLPPETQVTTNVNLASCTSLAAENFGWETDANQLSQVKSRSTARDAAKHCLTSDQLLVIPRVVPHRCLDAVLELLYHWRTTTNPLG